MEQTAVSALFGERGTSFDRQAPESTLISQLSKIMVHRMELEHYFALVRRSLPSVLLCAVLASIGAYLISISLPPKYEATAMILLRKFSPDGKANLDSLLALEELGRSYSHVMVQHSILSKVSTDLKLGESSEELARKVEAKHIPNTLLITVRAVETDGERAASIANKLAAVFISWYQEQEASRLARVRQRLIEEVAREDAEIQRLEAASKNSTTENEGINALVRLLQEHKASRNLIAEGLIQARIGSVLSLEELRLIEPARVPTAPSAPRPILNAIIAAMGGAMLGLLASALAQGSARNNGATSSPDQ